MSSPAKFSESESVRSARCEARPRSSRQILLVSLAISGLSSLALAGAVYLAVSTEGRIWALVLVLVCLGAGCLAFWTVIRTLLRHFRYLDRLRGGIVIAGGDEAGTALPLPPKGEDLEVLRLRVATAEIVARFAAQRATPDARLEAVLASLEDAVIVVTETGQVSLVNYAAKQLLGAERVKVGTSVFAALRRHDVDLLIDRSAETGAPVKGCLQTVEGDSVEASVNDFGQHGGAVIWFPAAAAEHRPEVEHDFFLHDQPPEPSSFGDDTPLRDLPTLVFDCETTGLDVTRDRIVSVGAVRLHGGRIYRTAIFDRLVYPGQAIPPGSTAIHGISDDMVKDAQSFADVFADFEAMERGTVLLGYNVLFDLAMLERECSLAEIARERPPHLDLLRLIAALEPRSADLSLEKLAQRFGVEIRGRHTALGDTLVTAEIYQRLLPLLLDAGVATFGQAQEFSLRARDIVRQQARMGW